jgi:hypothetical protein
MLIVALIVAAMGDSKVRVTIVLNAKLGFMSLIGLDCIQKPTNLRYELIAVLRRIPTCVEHRPDVYHETRRSRFVDITMLFSPRYGSILYCTR